MTAQNRIYQFQVDAIDGSNIDFADFSGKMILIVNTASACGFTYQYGQLQELYDKYKDKLAIVAVPSNDFGNQEPGSNEEIHTFCSSRFNITFPMTKKMQVRGADKHPLYDWLTKKELNGFEDNEVEWNFQKFLIDEQGRLADVFSPATDPNSNSIIEILEKKPVK